MLNALLAQAGQPVASTANMQDCDVLMEQLGDAMATSGMSVGMCASVGAGAGSGAGAGAAGGVRECAASAAGLQELNVKAGQGSLTQQDEDMMWGMLAKGMSDGHTLFSRVDELCDHDDAAVEEEEEPVTTVAVPSTSAVGKCGHLASCGCSWTGGEEPSPSSCPVDHAGQDAGHVLIVSSTSCDQGSKVCRLLPSWCSRRGGCAVAHTTHLRDAQDRLLSMWDGPQRSAQATAPAMAARAQPRVDHLEVASGSALVAHLASGLRTRADAPSLTPAGGAACPDLVHVSAPAAPQGVKFGAVDVLTVPQLATVMGALQHQAAGTVQCVFLNVLHAGDPGFAGADAADAADTGEDGFAGGRDGANVLSRMSGVRNEHIIRMYS